MTKYRILGAIVGAIFVVGLMATAPLVLLGIDFLTAEPVPTEKAVCAHLADLGVKVRKCPTWLADSKETYGEYYDNRLRCYAAAGSRAEVSRCDEPIEYMSDRWD